MLVTQPLRGRDFAHATHVVTLFGHPQVLCKRQYDKCLCLDRHTGLHLAARTWNPYNVLGENVDKVEVMIHGKIAPLYITTTSGQQGKVQ